MPIIKEFSIQLYSLREEAKIDFIKVFEKVSKIGFTGVEFAGYYNTSAKDMKDILDKYNLKSVGSHVQLSRLQNNLEEELAYNKIIGSKYIICPWSEIATKEDALNLAKILNPIAKTVTEAGFVFAYHNHAHEFVKDGDKYLLDILFDNLDKNTAFMELDTFFMACSLVDHLEYIKNNKARVKLLHIKQLENNESKKCVDLNKGIIDFKKIIDYAKEIGIDTFIFEQEEFEFSSDLSMENAFKHIMSL